MKVVIEMEEENAAMGLAELRKLDFITSVYETDPSILMEEALKRPSAMSLNEARNQTKRKLRELWSRKS
jgi:hypothetical protein